MAVFKTHFSTPIALMILFQRGWNRVTAIRQKPKIRHAITRAGQLQDAQVDFGAVDAGPEDLARLLLVEFAITYGNDRFVIPIELPVGSLCRADSLVVTNTFGERFVIRSSAESGAQAASWRMFQLAQPSLARTP